MSSNLNHSEERFSQEEMLHNKLAEIESLERLIDGSLLEIKLLQNELIDLEEGLNKFLDFYYGQNSSMFKNESEVGSIKPIDLDQAKKDIYEKIAKVCSKDAFHFAHSDIVDVRGNLLKIEGYLADGADEQSQSPQDMLSALEAEYSNLMQQISDLKSQKQKLAENPAFELKQEVLWANIKKAETISRIKEDITHRVNRPI